MNKKLLAIASLCAFSIAACESTGSTATDFAETYRIHSPDGVILTSDPAIIAEYRGAPKTTIVMLSDAPTLTATLRPAAAAASAP